MCPFVHAQDVNEHEQTDVVLHPPRLRNTEGTDSISSPTSHRNLFLSYQAAKKEGCTHETSEALRKGGI